MYGLLLENVRSLILEKFGEAVWKAAKEKAGISHHTFVIHNVYSETVIPRLVDACSEVCGMSTDEIMYSVGVRFVSFVGQYGYGRILKVLGRNMRDFLNGLDNLHEYLRFSYPKLSPPSFFVSIETRDGMVLHYRSKRKGYLYYVLGQIKEVGRLFYNVDAVLEVLSSDDIGERGCSYVIKINFDNEDFCLAEAEQAKNPFVRTDNVTETVNVSNLKSNLTSDALCVPSNVFFDIFPFHVLLDKGLHIQSVGTGLKNVILHVIGKPLTTVFDVLRPNLDFSWETVLMHTNVVFELMSKSEFHRRSYLENGRKHKHERIHLKGQMMHMGSWDSIIFLGTPILESLETMFNIGLYINDLSMHDSSRDLVLAGMQQSAELRLALDQEKQKSAMLEASMRRLDVEMSRTDALLYRMIPKQVADRLRKGEPALSTCETFENVTILFSDVVGFTSICSKILPMEVVKMLNEMYTKFDYLCEKHGVYKVETIGDAYMVVSGVPETTAKHAQNVADMALEMIDVVPSIPNPSLEKQHLRTRIGIHSGTVVAGVVGIKMPRYCLFGDTVNTASRMESRGAAMSIHISQSTKNSLPADQYKVKRRGSIPIKGKGTMQTYWLVGKVESPKTTSSCKPLLSEVPSSSSPSTSVKSVIDTKMEMHNTVLLRYSDSRHLSQNNMPQCPFSAIFREAYREDAGYKSDDLLDYAPSVGPTAEKVDSFYMTDPLSKYFAKQCPFSPRKIVKAHPRKNGLNAQSKESGLGTSPEELTTTTGSEDPVWVQRTDASNHVLDSQEAYNELLRHRTMENERWNEYAVDGKVQDPTGFTSDVTAVVKRNHEDAPQSQVSSKTSLLHIFCIGSKDYNDAQCHEKTANTEDCVAMVAKSGLQSRDVITANDGLVCYGDKKLLASTLHPNNNYEATCLNGHTHKNGDVKITSPTEEAHWGVSAHIAQTNGSSCVPKRSDGRCSIL